MAVTAKARSLTALNATTSLSTEEALAIVKSTAEEVKESGFGKKDGKLTKSEVRPRVMEDHGTWLRMEISSGWGRVAPWTVFSAVTDTAEDGRTTLTVGGLEKYKVLESKLFGLIPTAPTSILQFGLYKKYLGAIETQLRQADPQAAITVGVPQP